jgi:hypothetical protein
MANLVRSAIRSLIAGACPDLITLWQCTPCDAARSEVETPLLDEAPRKYGRHEPCFVCNVGYNEDSHIFGILPCPLPPR